MKSVSIRLASFLLGAFILSAHVMAADKPLLQEGKKTLYQRVLTTPGCKLANQPAQLEGVPQPAFSRFYVYERNNGSGSEWLKVGPDSYGQTVGWLPKDCVVDWKMQLTLAFTNPANRDRLLFFKEREALEQILDAENPASLVKPLQTALQEKNVADGILAQEPEFFIDLNNQFYLLPILSGDEVMTEEGFRTRVLNVASVTKADENSNAAPDVVSQLKEFSAAVVFVIDSTISMQPYIERIRQAVQNIYQRIEQESLGKQVKFGLVSFRSSLKNRPGLEYLTKMYVDPNNVQDGKDFLNKIKDLAQAKVSTTYWHEDPFAGVMEALDKIHWSEFGARYIVLITDASAIDGDDVLSGTGLGAEQVRLEASKHGIAIYTLHLKTPQGENDHVRAESQYRVLSNYTQTGTSLYYSVNAGNVSQFGQKVDALANAIISQVKAAYMGETAVGGAVHAQTEEEAKMLEDASLIGHAMQLAYLGSKTGTQAPPVFEAWISDRDLVKQNIPTTDVRVLLTKGQLSDLSDVMKDILSAANEGLISPSEMFTRLRSLAATMGTDPNQLKQKDNVKLAELGVLAEYLEDLPYQSEVLNLDEETWKGWDGLAQEKFIRNVSTKLRHYQRYNADVDRWVKLSEQADAREDVYPVPLEMMP